MNSRTNFNFVALIVATFFSFSNFLQAQEWQQIIEAGQYGDALAITQTADNNYFFTGYSVNKTTLNSNTIVAKLDANGKLLQLTEFPDSLAGGGFLITPAKDNGALLATLNKRLIKVDKNAKLLWNISHKCDFVREMPNGDVLTFSLEKDFTTNKSTLIVTLLSENGTTTWRKTSDLAYIANFNSFSLASDAYYCYANTTTAQNQKQFLTFKFDLSGNLTDTKTQNIDSDLPNVKKWNDENLLLYTLGGANEDLFIRKIKLDKTLWERKLSNKNDNNPLTIYSINEDKNHNIVLTGKETDSKAAIPQTNAFVMIIDEAGNIKSFERFGGEFRNDATGMVQSADGNYVICGLYESRIGAKIANFNSKIRVIKTKATAFSNVITGKIILDSNANCKADSSEQVFKNWKAYADNAKGERYFSVAQNDGSFHILANGDTLSLNAEIPSPYYKQTCLPSGVRFKGATKTLNRDIFVQKKGTCAYLLVDMVVRNLRPCFETPIVVRYCNQGSAMAKDAYAILKLDPNLTYIKSSISASPQTDGSLLFNLGDIAVDTCKQFTITVKTNCDNTLINKTLCNKIHLYPDAPCTTSSSQSRIKVEGNCTGDKVYFNIKNTGNNGMKTSKQYIVIEDDIMYMNGIFKLDPNETKPVDVLAKPGKTYRLIAEQTDTILGSIATAVAENCNKNGVASSGFVNQFAQGDEMPYEDVDCRMVTASFDPNDKRAVPEGFGNEHFITKNTDLEYTIRFQNMGSDTAFSVVIKDTLPTQLDALTIVPGASSHPYAFDLTDRGVARFVFENINLPNENADKEGSNGFVKFTIKQRRDLPLNTVINNKAALYFDFNDPVLTNMVFHTIGENWLFMIPTKENVLTQTDIKVYPNPFNSSTTIEVGGEYRALTFTVFDVSGRQLRHEIFNENVLHFERNNLLNGFYIYQIKDETGHILSNGKIIIQ
jgi:uncharacterized repeat protein (TIGR01451 family)